MSSTTIKCDEYNILEISLAGDVKLIINNTKVDLDKLEQEVKCAPEKKYKDGTCFSLNNLCSLVRAYNEVNDNIIELKFNVPEDQRREYRKYLLQQLTDRLKNICKDQLCWLKQEFVKKMSVQEQNDILYNTHRPSGPQGKFTWLNTINLDEVMSQYENMYPEFKYLGTVPMDFDYLEEKYRLSKYNYDEFLDKNIYKFGVIFNLDKSNQSGSHWVALYADMKDGIITFFDSYGMDPTKEIKILMNAMGQYCKNPTYEQNTKRHQYKNSECGVYSINFIARRLAGETLQDISKERLKDESVNLCRAVYFKNKPDRTK